MVNYKLYKIRPGKRQVWLDWCNHLTTIHRDEAIETLAEENLLHEMCLVFGEGDGFVLYRQETLSGRDRRLANMDRELNRKHFEVFDECLIPIRPLTEGYDLKSRS